MQIAKRASHRSDKNRLTPKKRHLETANLESIGTWFRMVRNWELSLWLDHLDILERYLLSLPEEKVFTNARWVCRQPCHNNAKQVGYLPNETDLFCGLPVKCSLVFPRPSPSSCRNSHFLEAIFAFVCCCVRSSSGSSAFRCVSTRLQSGSLLFLEKNCLDLTNSSNGRFSRAFRQCDRSSCSLVEGVSRS
jgi:hypothetical protein